MRNSKPFVSRAVILFFLCGFMFYSEESFGQATKKGKVRGKVLDSLSVSPLAFASIRVFENTEKKLVDGNITAESGGFTIDIPYGVYYVEVEFMGYQSYASRPFQLSEGKSEQNLGVIFAEVSTCTLPKPAS